MCSRKCDQVLHFLVRRLPVWQSSWVLGQGAHMRVEGFQKGERRKSLGHSCWHVKQPERESEREHFRDATSIFQPFSSLQTGDCQKAWTYLVEGRSDFVQFSSVTQSCPTLCDPMECSTPGLPVHHQLPESTQTHVHCVSDAWPSKLTDSPLALTILWMRPSRHFFFFQI